MTTTVMRDSIVGDKWIYDTAQAVPVQRVIDDKTGQPTGDILTGPVRLAFDALFELPKPSATVKEPKYGAMLLFTPYSDFSIMYEEYYRVAAAEFAEYWNAQQQQYYGIRSPFRDQGEKMKFGGFTPGCVFINATSKYKPPVIDTRHNPIVDPAKVYPGVWAICAVNCYAYKPVQNKGINFGLQSVMIIGDDTKFGGGAPDPNKAFGKVNVAAPIIRPDMARGMPTGAGPGAPPAGIPGYTQHGQALPAPGPAAPYIPPRPVAPAQGDDYDFMR